MYPQMKRRIARLLLKLATKLMSAECPRTSTSAYHFGEGKFYCSWEISVLTDKIWP